MAVVVEVAEQAAGPVAVIVVGVVAEVAGVDAAHSPGDVVARVAVVAIVVVRPRGSVCSGRARSARGRGGVEVMVAGVVVDALVVVALAAVVDKLVVVVVVAVVVAGGVVVVVVARPWLAWRPWGSCTE